MALHAYSYGDASRRIRGSTWRSNALPALFMVAQAMITHVLPSPRASWRFQTWVSETGAKGDTANPDESVKKRAS